MNKATKNIFERWVPLENIPKELFVEGLYDDYEGFRILVRGTEITSPMFRIKFESYLGYQNFDESDRLNSLDYFPVNTREWCLFKSNNSDYIDRVMKETAGKYDAGEIIHFAIVTSNDIVDILALKEPIVEEL